MKGTKDRVYQALRAAKGPLSGEKLAADLGLSRNAVWKTVDQLRREGHIIDAVTNRGYTLVSDANRLTEEAVRAGLTQDILGQTIILRDSVDSTNRIARELAQSGAAEGTVVIAREQTGGRGRFSRRFLSPRDGGVYMSVILRPTLTADRATLITAMAAVAVCRALEKTAPVKAEIKWVNDVYLNGRKVCGILCEAGLNIESGAMDYIVAGIGINTGPQTFPDELQGIATSVANEAGRDPGPAAVAAETLNALAELYSAHDPAECMDEYSDRSCVIGKKVTVSRGYERFDAVADHIDDEGSLWVDTPAGLICLRSGEISVKLSE